MTTTNVWHPPDGGCGWVVAGSGLMLNILMVTCMTTFGVIYNELLDEFNLTNSNVALFNTCQTITYCTTAASSGVFISRFGYRVFGMATTIISSVGFFVSAFVTDYRVMYLTFGVLAGVSWSTISICGNVATQNYFDKKRGLASGLVAMGIGIGVFLWPVITICLIELYGWRGALIVVSALHLHGVPCCALLRTPPTLAIQREQQRQEDKKTKQHTVLDYLRENQFSILKKKTVMLFLLGVLITDMGHHAPFIFTVARAEEAGISKQNSAFILSILGAVSACARPIIGWVGDRKVIRRVLLQGIMCALAGVTSCISFYLRTFAGLLTSAIAFAILSASFVSLLYPVSVDLVGIHRLPVIAGLELFCQGVGMSLCGVVGGTLSDLLHINSTFLVMGAIHVVGGLTIASVTVLLRKRERRKATMTGDIIHEIKINPQG